MTALLKTFSAKIVERGLEATSDASEIKDKDKDESGEDEEKSKKEDGKVLASKETDTTSDDCNNITAFLQAIAAKAPRVSAVPISLHGDKRVQE